MDTGFEWSEVRNLAAGFARIYAAANTLRAQPRQAQAGATSRRALPAAYQPEAAAIRPSCGYYIQLVQVEEAFKNLKGDLAIRPIYHQDQQRIEAHVFIAFLAYCLHATLAQQLKPHAPGLTPRSVLDKFAAVQMLDIEIPTTDGRQITLTRYTEPEPELRLLLDLLRLQLPAQSPPKITAAQAQSATLV